MPIYIQQGLVTHGNLLKSLVTTDEQGVFFPEFLYSAGPRPQKRGCLLGTGTGGGGGGGGGRGGGKGTKE